MQQVMHANTVANSVNIFHAIVSSISTFMKDSPRNYIIELTYMDFSANVEKYNNAIFNVIYIYVYCQ